MNRVKSKRAHCVGNHLFGDLFMSSTNKPIKRCKYCPAIQTKEEFLAKKASDKVLAKSIEVKMSHVDLFYF